MNDSHSHGAGSGPEITLVLPVFNEADNLAELFRQIKTAMDSTGRAWEALFVDDCSTDQSFEVIRDLAASHPEIRYIAFAENRGQSAAFCAGFDHAAGSVVVTMDTDLQNDPADIPAMLELYAPDTCMVIGYRAKRRDVFIKRVGSKIANRVRNAITFEKVRDTGCSLKVMNTELCRRLPRFNGMHRFLPSLMRLQGVDVAELRVNHRPRYSGESKYGTWDRLKAGIYDLIGVRWLIRRSFRYAVREDSDSRPGTER